MSTEAPRSAAKGGSLRRAWIAAWIVTVVMGITTMAFQVYHSLAAGHMLWPLAWLYGVTPLLIAMCVLEIVAEWHASSWAAKAVAYAVMLGAMFMSASGTGDVVRHAAPQHFSLLFGALLDSAELLAAFFIMNGPRAADAKANAEASEAARTAARLRAELAAEAERRQEAEAGLEAARAAVKATREEADAAVARAEVLAVKLAGSAGRKRRAATGTGRTRKQPGSGPAKLTVVTGTGHPVATGAGDAEALVLKYVDEGLSASEAGRKAGLSDSRGRQIVRERGQRERARTEGAETPEAQER